MIPDFFIVGATKCATTSIAHQLNQHFGIEMSNPKEPRILEADFHEKGWVSEYANYFDPENYGKNILRGDSNPNNFIIGYVPERIKLLNPDAKIIIILREPVARLVSHINYFIDMRPGREKCCFNHILMDNYQKLDPDKFWWEGAYVPYMCREWGNYKPMYIETGMYMYYIRKWEKHFPDSMLLINYEEFVENPQGEIDRICNFLGVETFVPQDTRHRNKGKPATPTMEAAENLRFIADNIYEKTNKELFDYIGMELW